MAEDANILGTIPGDLIGAASSGFPPAETCRGQYREAVVDVSGRFRARIRFEPFHFKRGKMSRWFWLACRAERVD
jgi:hypothetical protein